LGHAPSPQDAKTPGCHIAMCVFILGAFVSRPNLATSNCTV